MRVASVSGRRLTGAKLKTGGTHTQTVSVNIIASRENGTCALTLILRVNLALWTTMAPGTRMTLKSLRPSLVIPPRDVPPLRTEPLHLRRPKTCGVMMLPEPLALVILHRLPYSAPSSLRNPYMRPYTIASDSIGRHRSVYTQAPVVQAQQLIQWVGIKFSECWQRNLLPHLLSRTNTRHQ